MVDAILHEIRTTVFREELPQDFPPWATVLHLLSPLARRRHQDRSHARAVRRSRSVKRAIRPPQPGLPVCARCGDGQATSPGCEAGNRVNDCKVARRI
jgi:hypothetical protein